MVSMSRGPRRFFAVFLALAAIVAGASGCSSSDEPSREAGNLGTRICVLNSWTEKIAVQYTKKDTDTGTGPLQPGMQSCAEGTMVTYGDVEGILAFPEPARALFFQANNPAYLPPAFLLAQFGVNDPQPSEPDTVCMDNAYKVGDSQFWDNGTIRVSIKRLPDDGWKEFILIIEPSQGQPYSRDPCPSRG
jgi:hypothetical protein